MCSSAPLVYRERKFIRQTNQFVELLGDLAQSEDCLSSYDNRFALVLNDPLDRNYQLLGAEVAHGLEHEDLLGLRRRLFQQADQLLRHSNSTAVLPLPVFYLRYLC